MLDFFDNMIDLLHRDRTLWVLTYIVHMYDIGKGQNRTKRYDDIARDLIQELPSLADSLLDGLRNTVQVGNLSIDDVFLALSHDSRSEDLQIPSLDGTNKNLDFRGSYIERDELIVIDYVAYLECHEGMLSFIIYEEFPEKR